MATSTVQAMDTLAEDDQASTSNKNDQNTASLTMEGEDQPHSSGEEHDGLHSLQDRFASMEAKLSNFDNVLDLQRTVEKLRLLEGEADVKLEPFHTMPEQRLLGTERRHLNFYWDAMWFMSRVRSSHRALLEIDKINQEKDDAERLAKSKSLAEKETEESAKLSVDTFLKGERAKIAKVDWVEFISLKGDPDRSILQPIEVVSSEPEPQTILQLPKSRAGEETGKGKASAQRFLESDKDGESAAERPMPERIKIHSRSLLAIIRKVTNLEKATAKDRSMVYLRPYRDLVYYEAKLRELLETLENHFQGYDGTEPHVQPPDGQEGSTESSPADEQNNKQVNDQTGKENDKDPVADPSVPQVEQGDNTGEEETSEDKETSTEEESLRTITALLHLRCLMEFFDKVIRPKVTYIRDGCCARVSFHDIWHLFRPGDRVIDQTGKQAYVVLRVQTPHHKVVEPWLRWYKKPRKKKDSDSDSDSDSDDDEGEDPVILHCVYIDFDGKQFGPVSKRFKIPQFGELKEIRSLPVYPIRHAKERHLQDALVKRGKMLLDVARFKPMYYMGFTLDTRDEIDSQVVVDFNEALADEKRRKRWEPTIAPVGTAPEDRDFDPCLAPCCEGQAVHASEGIDDLLTGDYVRSLIPKTSLRAPSLLLSPRPLEDMPGNGEGLTDDELMVMTYRVFGFVLRSRKWAQLDLTFLKYENVDARSVSINAFERLELPTGHREMVKSLVIQHFRARQTSFTKDDQTDLVKGKGKGLIMLLHGAPGVGKTTTAEGIAELFKKPLFQITCGDLGNTAREVEEELEKNFALASRWGCILLLDEADVFLSARERMDFKRNGLVAVFLRVLEYYAGILFLTTNRIGDFDEAFASRVHMSLYYPELDEDKTLKVFKLNLDLIQDRFKKQERQIRFDPSSIEDFARQHFSQHEFSRWNGRQIRNLCQTALALAEFDAQGGELDAEIDRSITVSLELKHFKTVQAAYLDFGKYLGDIRGTKGDRRAIDYGLRARHDTPYQTKPSLFAQRADDMASRERHGHAAHLSSDASYHRVNSQADPFQPLSQSQMPFNQGMNVSPQQGYQQYVQPQQQQQQQQMAPMGNMGNMGFSTPMHQPGQGQMDPRMMQNQQSDGQYMRYQQMMPRGNNVGFQGSPSPQNSFLSPQEQGFVGSGVHQGLGSQMQAPSTPRAEPSSQGFANGQQPGQGA